MKAKYLDGTTLYTTRPLALGSVATGEIVTLVESYEDQKYEPICYIRTPGGRAFCCLESDLSTRDPLVEDR